MEEPKGRQVPKRMPLLLYLQGHLEGRQSPAEARCCAQCCTYPKPSATSHRARVSILTAPPSARLFRARSTRARQLAVTWKDTETLLLTAVTLSFQDGGLSLRDRGVSAKELSEIRTQRQKSSCLRITSQSLGHGCHRATYSGGFASGFLH